jgi:transposase
MEKESRYYNEEFKRQIVELEKSGKSVGELSREYKISKTSIRNWKRELGTSGQFGVAANLSESEKELRLLRKEVKQLRMENDILKQAALILGRKDV